MIFLNRESGTRLEINTTLRRLHHYQGARLVKTYPVAVGKAATPTPTGDYKIANKIMNPGGVLGSRWMGLNISPGNYGIHGTNNPASIGTRASLGCVRMYNHDVEQLFTQTNIGTPVHITQKTFDSQPEYKPHPPGPAPAEATAPVSSPAPASGGQTSHVYTVRPGDSLWKIANQYQLTLEELASYNQIKNPGLIYPGQKINIPAR